jgi:hypothetical protein
MAECCQIGCPIFGTGDYMKPKYLAFGIIIAILLILFGFAWYKEELA